MSAGQQKEKTAQEPSCHFLAPVSYVTFPRVPDVTDRRVNTSVRSSPPPYSRQCGTGFFLFEVHSL